MPAPRRRQTGFDLPHTAETLVDVLRHWAESQPDDRVFTFLVDGETEEVTLTFRELDRQARAIAAMLGSLSLRGERALLLYAPGLEYVCAFLGCLYAGVVAVPVCPPDFARLERTLPRLQAIASDAQASVALTSAGLLALADPILAIADELHALRWLSTDTVDSGAEGNWNAPPLDGRSLALLQYTSGSTRSARGVMVSHANLLDNLALMRWALHIRPETSAVCWLPPYHDMGLIGNILATVYAGNHLAMMSPLAFLQRPLRWLQAISRYRATIGGAPNFAYDLCVRKTTVEERATLDLRSWRVALCGAEPIRDGTLKRFAAAFEQSGFRREALFPAYGLAEATVIVSGGPSGIPPLVRALLASAIERDLVVDAPDGQPGARRVVGCGSPLQPVVVVDPATRRRCASDQIGEVWVSGSSVADGYWNRPEETAETFDARLEDTGEGPFLRTGDLGFVRDGQLFITGRLKDLIILHGANHYPQDIELTAEQSHPALRRGCGAAFSVDVAGEERLVLVYEVDTRREHDWEDVGAAVRQAVLDEHLLAVHAVSLVAPGTVPKTSSGKIQRHACKAAFLTVSLDSIWEWRAARTATEAPTAPVSRIMLVEDDLRSRIAGELGLDPSRLDADEAVVAYGLESVSAISLTYEIETHYGVELPSTTLLEGVSISRLAQEIVRLEDAALRRPAAQTHALHREATEYALSYGERALWFLNQLAPAGVAYHIVHAFRSREKIDASALQRAVDRLVTRHAGLRTSYALDDAGEPARRVHDRAHDSFRAFDATRWTPAELHERLSEEAYRPFDLARPTLLRVGLFRRSDEDVLLVALHHIVADGWSVAVIARDLEELYRAERERRPPALESLTSQYPDYVRWQSDLLAGPDGERLWAFWERKLTGASAVLNLPTDRPRPPVQTARGATYAFRLSRDLGRHLQRVAKSNDATLYMTLLAALQVLLHRYTGQHDIVVGSPTLGRRHGRFDGLVGYLVNPVVLRADLSDDPPFETFLRGVRSNVIEAIAHQDYPFPLLVERLHPVRDASRSPLFQVAFEWLSDPWEDAPALSSLALSEPGGQLAFAGLTLETFPVAQQGAQFDLTLRMTAIDGRLSGSWQYNADLFDPATIERLHDSFATLLEGVVADPRQRVASLPLMPSAERRRILVEWNDTHTHTPTDRCLHELFEAQAVATPDATATIFDGDSLTYRELDRRANQVAHHLRRLGLGPEHLVGLLAGRSADMVVALLGILKAGAAYVPMDPSYPLERLTAMLEDAQVSTLITTQQAAGQFLADGRRVVRLDEASCDASGRAAVETTAENLAYVIYTSGSTGRPKGVQIPHRALVNCITAMAEQLGVTERDVFLAVTSLSFDIAALELFLPLVTGGSVVIVPREVVADGRRLAGLIASSGATLMQATPSVWRMLTDSGWSGNRDLTVLSGGETLPRDLANLLCERTAAVWNLYGPTETTIWSSVHPVRAGSGSVPIGRPIANTEVYVLDPRLQPVPIGVVGELYIGGVGLARGYRGQPELTAERFIRHPFREGRGARLYKTGDLARYLPDGSLEFLGRRDQQVKVRGFRIELGEIEAVLCEHGGVREAVVVPQGDADRDRPLVAYIVARSGEVPMAAELGAFLKEKLPSYMVPSRFVFLDDMPLLPNGKINRAALPAPFRNRVSEDESAAPRTGLETVLAALWEDVLGTVAIGRDDDFFELGGHSLQAAQLAAKVSTATGREIPVQFIILHPTVAAAAGALEANQDGVSRPSRRDRVVVLAPENLGTPSFITIEHRPLLSMFAAGKIAPVDAAALTYFPRALLAHVGASAEDVHTWCNDLPMVVAIDDTPVGRLAILILPRFDDELYADPEDIARVTREAMTTAASLGAQIVALTGLLASALDYGRALAAPAVGGQAPAVTTGHTTTCAAMVLSIGGILKAANRDLASERVAILGLGSIGRGTLELMLTCLPHPAEIALCDVFGKRDRLEALEQAMRERLGFHGAVRLLPSRGEAPLELYGASLIIGATNVPDLLDVDRLSPGTLIVDDSAPHCFRPSEAFRRLEHAGDILFTEGGVLTASEAIPQLRYLPTGLAPMREALMEHFPVADDRRVIPACMLSSLLSARFPELSPTVGPVEASECLEHYRALGRLGFRAATLRCGRRVLDGPSVGKFRSRFADASVLEGEQRSAPSQASAWSWSSTGLEEDDGMDGDDRGTLGPVGHPHPEGASQPPQAALGDPRHRGHALRGGGH